MAYRVALCTGFRASELRRLKVSSFDLDSDPPTITVLGKNGDIDAQPIHPDQAALIRPWLAGREGKVFTRLPGNTARMIRADQKAARTAWIESAKTPEERKARENSDFLRYRNAAGEVSDFHATRHTYISGIVASGASVKTAQELARHSRAELTIGRYSHTRLHDIKGAVPTLPTAPEAEVESLRATGTDEHPFTAASVYCQFDRRDSLRIAEIACENAAQQTADIAARNPSGNEELCSISREKEEEAPVGVEPTVADLQPDAMPRQSRGKR
jgi:hypothetical protein